MMKLFVFFLILALASAKLAVPQSRELRMKKKSAKSKSSKNGKTGKSTSTIDSDFCLVNQPFTCDGLPPVGIELQPDCLVTISCAACGGGYVPINAYPMGFAAINPQFIRVMGTSITLGVENLGLGGNFAGTAVAVCVMTDAIETVTNTPVMGVAP